MSEIQIARYGKNNVLLAGSEEWISYEALAAGYVCSRCGQHPRQSWNGKINYPRCACGHVVKVEPVEEPALEVA